MRELIIFIATMGSLVLLAGVIKPYIKGFNRKKHALAAAGAFVVALVAVPPMSEEAKAAAEAERVASEHQEVLKAALVAPDGYTYTRDGDPKTYELVGAEAFETLSDLEPGAFYAAARSESCDKTGMGDVSLNMSKKDAPLWFIDCDNGNRFMITPDEAAEAAKLLEAGALTKIDRAPDCTTTSVAACSITKAQKNADETTIVSLCDMGVESVLISDPDWNWSWDYAFGDGDNVVVTRGFKAQNAFGAELKHQYRCEYNAATNSLVDVKLTGPTGTQDIY